MNASNEVGLWVIDVIVLQINHLSSTYYLINHLSYIEME